jgi:hypothetical protein
MLDIPDPATATWASMCEAFAAEIDNATMLTSTSVGARAAAWRERGKIVPAETWRYVSCYDAPNPETATWFGVCSIFAGACASEAALLGAIVASGPNGHPSNWGKPWEDRRQGTLQRQQECLDAMHAWVKLAGEPPRA